MQVRVRVLNCVTDLLICRGNHRQNSYSESRPVRACLYGGEFPGQASFPVCIGNIELYISKFTLTAGNLA